MGCTSAVFVSALFLCIFHASSALVIPSGKAVYYDENSEAYNVHILESGSKFDEKIIISEGDDLEYFHVPAHNGLTEADYLYDFRNNLSVSRVKSEAKCYLGPLPENLPKPKDLRTGLERQSRAPSKDTVIVKKYWAVSEQVDKSLLRPEVQHFCDQFPMYRLEKVNFEYAAGLDKRGVERVRIARSIDLTKLPFCDQNSLPTGRCNPNDWLYSFHIRQSHCTYWVIDCRFDTQRLKVCEDWEHLFSSMVCYKIRCP